MNGICPAGWSVLVPGRSTNGERRHWLGKSQHGDRHMRTLLIQSARGAGVSAGRAPSGNCVLARGNCGRLHKKRLGRIDSSPDTGHSIFRPGTDPPAAMFAGRRRYSAYAGGIRILVECPPESEGT